MEFEEYVAARGQALLRFGFVLTRHRETAEDVVQSALAEAFRRWGKVSRADHPDAVLAADAFGGPSAGSRRGPGPSWCSRSPRAPRSGWAVTGTTRRRSSRRPWRAPSRTKPASP